MLQELYCKSSLQINRINIFSIYKIDSLGIQFRASAVKYLKLEGNFKQQPLLVKHNITAQLNLYMSREIGMYVPVRGI